MNWNEVIGQKDICQQLEQRIEEGKVPHAILLCGPRGCGKMAVAMAMASHLITSTHTTDKQQQEAMLREWNHPDLTFSYPTIKLPSMSSEHKPVSNDFAKDWSTFIQQGPYFSIEQWMTQIGAANQQAIITAGESDELTRKLSLKSSQGGYKVAIIWMAERMNQECANKILKILEEPPQQTVFILVSEEPDKLLETIRSRTQRIVLPQIQEEDIREALISRRGLDEEVARRIARIAHGNWLKALETLDSDSENRQFFDMFTTLMRLAYMRNIKELKHWTDNIYTFGREKQRRFLSYMTNMIRENFVYNFHIPELNYMTQEEENFSKNFAKFINESNVIEFSEMIERARRDIGQNANAKVVFYDLALQTIVLILRK